MIKATSSSSARVEIPTNEACGECGSSDKKLQACSVCHFRKYCGAECQKAHWPKHRLVCKQEKKEHFWSTIQQKAISWLPKQEQVINYTPGGNVAPLLEKDFQAEVEGKVAIDLGCGTGKSTVFLLQRGWKVIAIDPNRSALDYFEKGARAINSQWIESGQLIIQCSTLEEYDFPVKASLIVVNDVLPYCNPGKMREICAKIFNALTSDGILMGSLFDQKGGKTNWTWVKCWFVEDKKIVEDFVDAMSLELQICRNRPKAYIVSDIIEFSAKKKA